MKQTPQDSLVYLRTRLDRCEEGIGLAFTLLRLLALSVLDFPHGAPARPQGKKGARRRAHARRHRDRGTVSHDARGPRSGVRPVGRVRR